MKSNPDKCHSLPSISEKVTTNHVPDLKIKTEKTLGITTDSNLCFQSHV